MSRKPTAKDKCVSADGHRPEPAYGLTSIHGRIHCAATSDSGDFNDEYDELDHIQVEHFLQTLARIALSVAARQAGTIGAELG